MQELITRARARLMHYPASMVMDRPERRRWRRQSSIILGTALALAAPAVHALSVYHVGNSLVLQNEQRGVIKALAVEAGHAHEYSMSVILGAPLSYIWSNPASSGGWEGQPYPVGLSPARAWDALIVEPYDRDFRFYPYDDPASPGYSENDVLAANDFYVLALAGNPRAQLCIYEIFPLASGWSAIPEQRTLPHALTVADQVNKLHPSAPPVMVIPAGDVIQKLGALADQNQLPHIAGHTALYGDDEHLNEVGSYAVALTHLVCLYGDDPHVYSDRPVYPPGSDSPAGDPIWKDTATYQLLGPLGGAVWPETAEIIKNVVAEVTSNSPRSGVSAGLRIATAALPAAVVGQSYSVKLTAELGTPPYRWSVVGGALPAGLRLDGDTLSGAPTAAGTASFTVQLSDGSNPPRAVTRSLTLAVAAADVTFTIDAAELPGATRGTRFTYVLHATGGVAPVSWALESGRLPAGLALGSDGSLQGSPGEDGTFVFAVVATDGATGAPRSARRSFSLVVAPLGEATVIASRRDPVCSGAATTPASRLGWSAAKVVGHTDNAVRFDAQWDDQNLYVVIQVQDANVAIGSAGTVADSGDAVELYVNADNAKSILYGARDRRVVVGATGEMWLPDGRSSGIASTSSPRPDGYAVELVISWSNLGVVPRANITLGFDIANHDDDGAGRTGALYWYGGPEDANQPAGWGNLLLAASAVSAGLADGAACDAAGASAGSDAGAADVGADAAAPTGSGSSAARAGSVAGPLGADAGAPDTDANSEALPADASTPLPQDDGAGAANGGGTRPDGSTGRDADPDGRTVESPPATGGGCAMVPAGRKPSALLGFVFIAAGVLLRARDRHRGHVSA